jgi:hypothetical protein
VLDSAHVGVIRYSPAVADPTILGWRDVACKNNSSLDAVGVDRIGEHVNDAGFARSFHNLPCF